MTDRAISIHTIRLFGAKVDKSKLRISSLQLLNAGHIPGRIMQRVDAVFERWAFVYITEGRGYYQAGEGPRQQVEAGSLFCLYPGTVFQYGPHDDDYWDEYYFTVDGDRIQEWLDNWSIKQDGVMKVGCDESKLHKMEMIFRLMETGEALNLDRAALLLENFLFELTLKAEQKGMTTRSTLINRIVDDLTSMVYEPLEAAALALRHHISVSTLRRMVLEHSGYPLHEFIHRLKTAEAKKLLLNTDHTVKEIGERLAYKDVFYFSRLFKKHVGVSPKTFRDTIGF
ncbi:AraC family transcriptional regulator [Paenibacillaceae bacterium]|nr:AraC family transcriptional regulator [Paenibacillaceae bacterium]